LVWEFHSFFTEIETLRKQANEILMRTYHFTILIIIGNLLLSSFAWSQNSTVSNQKASIQLIARSQKEQILLRWAVDQPLEWKKSNTYGFYLNKFVFKRHGKRLESPEKVNNTPILIKPDPLETWQDLVEEDNYAAIIAQAIYGEGFEVSGTNNGPLANIVNTAQEIEQRFSFALYAADMNFPAAIKAGWGYVDTDVKSGEEYIYQISSAIPENILQLKSAAINAGIDNYEPLPQPISLQGIWGDKNVLLTWEYQLFKNIYTSYNIERSEDGENFKELSPLPLTNLNDKPDAPAKRMYYIDSLVQNNTKYFYRVYGISPFGEHGPHSEVISGSGSPTLVYTPRISGYQFTENENEAIIQWEYLTEGEHLITKFSMSRADKDSGPYEIIFDSIPKNQRTITYSKLNPSNYIKVKAIGKNHQEKESHSSFIQPIDSVPPTPPTILKGAIDSLGIVSINWQKNTEPDVLGYRVFRKNIEKEEFTQLTVNPIERNTYKDTVQLQSLNSKVYYSIIAVDKRYNQSGFSKVIELKKPDIVPPTAPIFTKYEIINGAVKLDWELSSEEHATHYLYKKDLTLDTAWKIAFSTTDSIRTYTDKETIIDHSYRYAIMAKDKSGLESEPSTPLTVTITDLKPKEYIRSFSGYVDRDQNQIILSWKLKDKEQISEVTIYKNASGEPPVTFKILPAKLEEITDTAINPNNAYTYQIRATLNNGKMSTLKSITVNY
jgi:fibronectin type 3 domain-containing protein